MNASIRLGLQFRSLGLLLFLLLGVPAAQAQKTLSGTYKLKSVEIVDEKGKIPAQLPDDVAEELEHERIGLMEDGIKMIFAPNGGVKLMEEGDETQGKYKIVGNKLNIWMDDLTMKSEPDLDFMIDGKALILYMPASAAYRFALRFVP